MAMLAYDPPYEPIENELREIYLADKHRRFGGHYSHAWAPRLWHYEDPMDPDPDPSDEPAFAWYLYRRLGSYVVVGRVLGIDRFQARTRCLQYLRRATIQAGLPAPTINQLRRTRRRREP
jgi:hypothetical protein